MTMSAQEAITTSVRLQMTLRRESRKELADALGLTVGALGHRFTGRARWSVDDLDRLAEHYHVEPARLLAPPLDALASAGFAMSGGSVNGRCHTEKRRPLGGSVFVIPRPRLAPLHVAA